MTSAIRKELVTGATSGIGQAIAGALAANGIQVLLTGVDKQHRERVIAGRLALAG